MRRRIILGPCLTWAKRIAGVCLMRLQGTSLYRKIARSLRSQISLGEANEKEFSEAHGWLYPGLSHPFTPAANIKPTCFLAKRRDRIVGSVFLLNNRDEGTVYAGYWLSSLVVRRAYRRMGIGEDLCRAAIHRAAAEGAKELSLLVREDNHRAAGLYRKLGFQCTVVPPLEAQLEAERSSLGFRRVLMRKRLSPQEE